jgi:hypothetical protein
MGDLVNFVNSNEFTWKAQIDPRFEGMTLAELKDSTKLPQKSNLVQSSSRATRQLSQTNSKIYSKSEIDTSVLSDNWNVA